MAAEGNSNRPSTSSNDPNGSVFGVPEGRLGICYEKALTKTLDKFLSSVKFSLFKSKYPEIYKKCGEELRHLHKELLEQLKNAITVDIETLCKETNVFSSLKSLDDTIAKQSGRAGEESWRPTGNPEDDTRDHIYFQKQKHKKCLEFLLETNMVENNKLEEMVYQNHREILQLKKEIDDSNEEIQSNMAAVNNTEIQKMGEAIHIMFEED